MNREQIRDILQYAPPADTHRAPADLIGWADITRDYLCVKCASRVTGRSFPLSTLSTSLVPVYVDSVDAILESLVTKCCVGCNAAFPHIQPADTKGPQ